MGKVTAIAFAAGAALPALLLPFLLLVLGAAGERALSQQPVFHFLPLIWGVWNVLYFDVCRRFLPGGRTARLLVTGGILGFLVALFAIVVLRIPQTIGITGVWIYAPFVVAPVLYAVLWTWIVGWLNVKVGLKD